MNPIKTLANIADIFSKPATAYAHCDIPCGIYDPYLAQMAAHTVVRTTQLILDNKDNVPALVRNTNVKEEHAELCKHEIRVIWGDYFKPEMVEKNPQIHALVWNIMKLASKAKQEVNMQAAEELLEQINAFAELFWKTKGIETYRAKAPYPTGKMLVVPKL